MLSVYRERLELDHLMDFSMTITTYSNVKQVLRDPVEYKLVVLEDDKGVPTGPFDFTYTYYKAGANVYSFQQLAVPNTQAKVVQGFFSDSATTVYTPVESIQISPSTYTLAIGATLQLAATARPNKATNPLLVYSSNFPTRATVSVAGGLVTGVSAGVVIITIASIDVPAVTTTVTVTVS